MTALHDLNQGIWPALRRLHGLQAVWSASVLVAFPVALRHWQRMVIKEAHLEVLSGAAATGAVFAELFMIKSLLVFDPLQRVRGGLRSLSDEDSEPPSPAWNTSRVRPSVKHCCSARQLV